MSDVSDSNDKGVHAVYFPSWKVYKGVTPAHVVECGVNAVFYAFIIPNEDGTLKFLDDYADTQIPADGGLGCLGALGRLKEEHGYIKAVLSIGGGSGSAAFPILAATKEARETFARCAHELVDLYGLDGIDIDWEHPKTPEHGRDYALLLEACRQRMPRPRYLLTVALPVDQSVLGLLDLDYLCNDLLDYINLMCYDFSGPWASIAGHHSQLFASRAESDALGWTPASTAPGMSLETLGHVSLSRFKTLVSPALRSKMRWKFGSRPEPDGDEQGNDQDQQYSQTSGASGVQFLTEKGVPASKILLGVPLYARLFPGASRTGDDFDCGQKGDEDLVMDCCDVPRGWLENAHIDNVHFAASYSHEEEDGTSTFASFDVPQTVEWKRAFARQFGLGGLVFWAFGGDRMGDRDNLKFELVDCNRAP